MCGKNLGRLKNKWPFVLNKRPHFVSKKNCSRIIKMCGEICGRLLCTDFFKILEKKKKMRGNARGRLF